MVELHHEGVFKKIPPPRHVKKKMRRARHKGAIDERPGVVDVTGAQPGDDRAEINLSQHQGKKTDCAGADARRRWHWLGAAEPLGGPYDCDVDRAGKNEVGRQAILRNFDAISKAGRDHPPADGPLQRAKPEDEPEPRAQSGSDPTPPQEPKEWQEENNPNRPT